MADIIFYGKLNCINNNKQVSLLKAAGHNVEIRDILAEDFKQGCLRGYFGSMPVKEWFNMTAPAIKNGDVSVDSMTETEALDAMVQDKYLIRRPLMDIQGKKICGFRYDELDLMIGLAAVKGKEEEMETLKNDDMTTCPFTKTDDDCDKQAG